MAGLLSCRACLLPSAVRIASYNNSTAETAARIAATQLGQQRGRSYTNANLFGDGQVDAPTKSEAPGQDGTVAEQKRLVALQRTVTKHLAFMDDPWKIAQHVEQTLLKDRYDEALLLTQRASKDLQVVVAWNHLIGYQLEKQQLRQAFCLFNEMKKRGQLPNVQTYTVIFKGCARSQHPKLAVAEAVKHYNMLMVNKRLKPNSIHLNAVLNVCARAGDLDSMFLIADTANNSTRAPTAYTYTTIINALRHNALNDIKDLPQDQQAIHQQKAVDRAKGLWMEVMEKWKQGRLVIDEELVCAMGRVLLMAPKREDKREVLDLLHQTMNIPNLSKALGTDSPPQDPAMRNVAVTRIPMTASQYNVLYAVPGRNTLALLLSTLASIKLTTSGIKYWNLMVRHYGVVPDQDNWHRMFGMLKVAKASSHAASILEIIPNELVNPKPYQIAMQTCIRDNINQKTIANSTTILNSMMDRLSVPDIYTLRLYLRVALVCHHDLRSRAQKGDEQGAKREYGLQITTALGRLWEPYKKVHYHYFKATPAPEKPEDRGILYNNKREVIALARLMFSSFNKVINEGMLPDEDLRDLRRVGAKINREIQTFYSNREKMEPKLGKLSMDGSPNETKSANPMNDAQYKPSGGFVWDTTKSGNTVSLQ